MPSTLATLRTNQVDVQIQALLDMLWVPNHVHVHDSARMKPVDGSTGWHTYRRNEQLRLRLDNDVYQLHDLPFRVVIAGRPSATRLRGQGTAILRLTRVPSDLWQQDIHTKWRVLVVEIRLELIYLLSKTVRTVAEAADDTDTASIAHRCGQLRTCCDAHPSEHDWVLNTEQIRQWRADLLYRSR
jgi:hypothetical protein